MYSLIKVTLPGLWFRDIRSLLSSFYLLVMAEYHAGKKQFFLLMLTGKAHYIRTVSQRLGSNEMKLYILCISGKNHSCTQLILRNYVKIGFKNATMDFLRSVFSICKLEYVRLHYERSTMLEMLFLRHVSNFRINFGCNSEYEWKSDHYFHTLRFKILPCDTRFFAFWFG